MKPVSVVFYPRNLTRTDWGMDLDEPVLLEALQAWRDELEPLGVQLSWHREEHCVIDVRGYADLLNSIRLRSPKDSIGNLCLGHIIGPSPNRDPVEDLRRGINRVAFAPEMIEPDGSDKVVCHNCGCGC